MSTGKKRKGCWRRARPTRRAKPSSFGWSRGGPSKSTTSIHGTISFQTDTIKDQVLIKSDGSPAYNFSCVVDDSYLGVTHILRGDDHISNTPKQILFYEALGLTLPEFGHMPLILGQDGAKLSKRHGGVSVREYRAEGFLPQALANYLILLGWTPKDGREIMPLAEAVREFEITAMNDVQAKFDIQKLRWINSEYIMADPGETLLPLIKATAPGRGLRHLRERTTPISPESWSSTG